MRSRCGPATRRGVCAAGVLLLLSACPQSIYASEPVLGIWLTDWETAFYPVGEIESVRFDNDSLVVVTPDGIEYFTTIAIDRLGFFPDLAAVPVDIGAGPETPRFLSQNRPNPCFSGARIAFEVPQDGPVDLSIYGVDGRLVRTLLREYRTAGPCEVAWDGCTDSGQVQAGGIYYYVLSAPGVTESRRLVLLP